MRYNRSLQGIRCHVTLMIKSNLVYVVLRVIVWAIRIFRVIVIKLIVIKGRVGLRIPKIIVSTFIPGLIFNLVFLSDVGIRFVLIVLHSSIRICTIWNDAPVLRFLSGTAADVFVLTFIFGSSMLLNARRDLSIVELLTLSLLLIMTIKHVLHVVLLTLLVIRNGHLLHGWILLNSILNLYSRAHATAISLYLITILHVLQCATAVILLRFRIACAKVLCVLADLPIWIL